MGKKEVTSGSISYTLKTLENSAASSTGLFYLPQDFERQLQELHSLHSFENSLPAYTYKYIVCRTCRKKHLHGIVSVRWGVGTSLTLVSGNEVQ